MGWTGAPSWTTAEKAVSGFIYNNEASGYTVLRGGFWFLIEKDDQPVDLVYLLVEELDNQQWYYKDLSIGEGPYYFDAPLWMVQRAHPKFKDDRYYKEWLKSYPQAKQVAAKPDTKMEQGWVPDLDGALTT